MKHGSVISSKSLSEGQRALSLWNSTYFCGNTKIDHTQPTFTFTHLVDAFIQSDLQLHSGYTFSLVCVFPGNRTHNLLCCWRNALPLSHTGTLKPVKKNIDLGTMELSAKMQTCFWPTKIHQPHCIKEFTHIFTQTGPMRLKISQLQRDVQSRQPPLLSKNSSKRWSDCQQSDKPVKVLSGT